MSINRVTFYKTDHGKEGSSVPPVLLQAEPKQKHPPVSECVTLDAHEVTVALPQLLKGVMGPAVVTDSHPEPTFSTEQPCLVFGGQRVRVMQQKRDCCQSGYLSNP